MTSLLRRRDRLPDNFADLAPSDLKEVFGGPTLVHLAHDREAPPLFISTVLHGNEPAGLEVVQELYRRRGSDLGRETLLFIGNVDGASLGLRRLKDQPDYNRIWGPGGLPENHMAAEIIEELRANRPCCSLDIHNNSSKNPPYAIVMHVDDATLALAARFAPRAMFADYPMETLTFAVGRMCPALTLECGEPGNIDGRQRAVTLLERCLDMEALPKGGAPELYANQGTLMIEPDVPFRFGDVAPPGGVAFRDDLESLNFVHVAAGTPLAYGAPESLLFIRVQDRFGEDVTDRFLHISGAQLLTRRRVVPAMLTHDHDVIVKDCVGYLMEEL
jgi:hypothetical protein